MNNDNMSGCFVLSKAAIDTYLQIKTNQGISSVTIGKYRTPLQHLLRFKGDSVPLTKEITSEWRKNLVEYGYGKITIQNYVKVVNDFFRTVGHRELCIPKPLQNDLTGKTFGYLTVLEATDKRKRKDVVWRCICKCGKEVEIPAVMLLGGHTTSCGCLNVEILQHANRYVEGTSIRQCLDDRTINPHSASGFVGVQAKRDKWIAYIHFKGVRYNLGTYSSIEDAVKARAQGKEWVMEEAARLNEEYADQYGEMPHRPPRPAKQTLPEEKPVTIRAKRSNNTSGYPGVTMQYGKWNVSISVKGYRYRMGVYDRLEDAVEARKRAEALVAADDLETLKAICRNQK